MSGISLWSESSDFGLQFHSFTFPGCRIETSSHSISLVFFLTQTDVIAWAQVSKPVLYERMSNGVLGLQQQACLYTKETRMESEAYDTNHGLSSQKLLSPWHKTTSLLYGKETRMETGK